MITIQKYDKNEFEQIYNLWCLVFANSWPIEREQLADRVIKGDNFVAIDDNKIVGFINGQSNGTNGQITLIMVDNDSQRKGVGTKLLTKIKEIYKQSGIKDVSVGSGAGAYFWPGVPTNLPSAFDFFKKNGLKIEETNLDMVGDLSNYQTPTGVMEKVAGLNLEFKLLEANKASELINFEKENFPNWTKYFEGTIGEKHLDNILIVRDKDKILGSVLLFGDDGFVWSRLLVNAGGFGALGVSEDQRGKGVGLALAAKATEILQQRGIKNSFLGWTYLDEWYGKLGYKVWMKYEQGKILL